MASNRYVELVRNIFIFAVGTFASKAVVFFMTFVYSRVLTQAQFGLSDIIVQTANVIIPIVTLSIIDGVLRYGLEKNIQKSDVLSTAIVVIIAGFLVFLCFMPLFFKMQYIGDYVWLIYLYVLASSISTAFRSFVRVAGKVKLFAYSGVQNTLLVVAFNIILLVFLKLGVVGFVLSTVLADIVTAIYLFFVAKLHRYIKFSNIDKNVLKTMIVFSVPLIPNTLMWLVISISDRYLVTYMVGQAANGLYSMAYKIPSLVVLISGIFTPAWQMSSVSEYNSTDRSKFYNKVLRAYISILFTASAGIMLFAKVFTSLLAKSYYDSWRYMPVLLVAVVFQCLSGFYANIYLAAQKSGRTLATSVLGALTNIVLNILLIPFIGAMGAAVATFVSYLLLFVLRYYYIRKTLNVKINMMFLVINCFCLIASAVVMTLELSFWIPINIVFLLVILALNYTSIKKSIMRILKK